MPFERTPGPEGPSRKGPTSRVEAQRHSALAGHGAGPALGADPSRLVPGETRTVAKRWVAPQVAALGRKGFSPSCHGFESCRPPPSDTAGRDQMMNGPSSTGSTAPPTASDAGEVSQDWRGQPENIAPAIGRKMSRQPPISPQRRGRSPDLTRAGQRCRTVTRPVSRGERCRHTR